MLADDVLVLLTAWVAWMQASGTPPSTVALRRYYVTRCARANGGRLLELGVDELAGWLGTGEWSANTRKSARSALRSFYGWAVVTGRLETSPAHLLPAVRVPRAVPKPVPDTVFRAALEEADERTRLALLLAGVCGLRRGEVVAVHSRDLEEDLVGWSLRVTGKGGHTRLVPVPDEVAEAVAAAGGWAFPSPRGGHLTPHHMGKLLSRALGGHSAHTLRHRAASTAYAGTRDLRAVQELLGHSRPETTAGYVRVPDDAVRAAMRAAC